MAFHAWSFALCLAVAVSVREESMHTMDLLLESDEYLDEEMKLVPAKISKAIRRTLRLSKEATEKAEKKKSTMTAEKEEQEKKAAEAEKKSDESDKAADEASKKREDAEEKVREANKAMETQNEAQSAWKAANTKLQALEKKYKEEDNAYKVLSAKVKKEVGALIDQKNKANIALQALAKQKSDEAAAVEKLKSDVTAKGGIAMEASEKAEAATEAMEEAEKKATESKLAAEEAQAELVEAKAKAEAAEQKFLDAKGSLEKTLQVASLVEVRESVQAFYDAIDKSTKSMEKEYEATEGQQDAKPAHELLRSDPNVKAALVSYNEMVLTFRRLHVKSKDFYTFVADSVGEIHENAEAALQLQCDPTEELERAAKKSKDKTDFFQKCGSGVWKDLKLEQQRFPHLEKGAIRADTVVKEEPKAEESA
ncbi:unnamed protein product [Durusdinium trenchii]|uniref:Uncharacterized protein n=2 Tax=Durusdinium trenchii TaxID=1381693 RepID=A0ABP0R072_9DINO